MPDSQRYPLTLYLLKYEEGTVVFLALQVEKFLQCFWSRKLQQTEIPQLNIINFLRKDDGLLMHQLIRQNLTVNRTDHKERAT